MKKRHLFYAKKGEGTVHIDKAKKETGLLCPFCKRAVIPKQGEEKIWHFAHKGKSCLKSNAIDNEKSQKLAGFITKTTDKIEVPEDPIFFLCCKCFKKGRKEVGKKWNETEYICKDCFKLM